MSKVSFLKDKYYDVAYSGGWYPGMCVEEIDEESSRLDFLIPSGNFFRWPPKKDVQKVFSAGALTEIGIVPVSNGRLWSVVDKIKIDRLYKR